MIHLPAWSPDGERLAVWYDDTVRGQITSSGIATVRYDGSDFRSVAVLPRWPVPLSWSPDGREIAFTGAPDQGGTSDIWGVDVQTGSIRRITSSGLAPRWSPDGQRIAFRAHPGASSGWRLTIVNRDGNDRRELIIPSDQANFTWTPDGRIIYYNEAGAGLFVVDLFGAVAPFTHSRTVPHWCGTP